MSTPFTVIIPARLASSRLPEKALADIAGKPMVVRVAERAKLSEAQRIVVATDHTAIAAACSEYGIEAVLTGKQHASGTARLAEAALLLDQSAPDDVAGMRRMAERLRRLLADADGRWVLLKGGHLPGNPVDLLFDGDRMIQLDGPRIDTDNLHGTGCTLSAALAALIPQSADMPAAARAARDDLTGALAASSQLTVGRRVDGRGHGPVHHFHRLWSRG